MKNLYIVFVLMLFGLGLNAQNITGKVIDLDTNEPLIGASIFVKGTTNGTTTDLDGAFTLPKPSTPTFKIEINYLGYKSKTMTLTSEASNLGVISLKTDAQSLDEVTITGVMDIVMDRRTPVAVSTITTAEIQAKGGNTEFPDLMKNTPSIYVANQSGGYGEAQIFTRGFDQTNTAFLLNGQPINGMEDGKMYWSNWSGMSDVATAIQVQRGLGSSKLAISSVGGTTNIIMKATDKLKGGSVGFTVGNDSYLKGTVSYNTGLMNDKFGVSVLMTHWQGNGWSEGTKGQGQNYFISAGYKPNENHSINFLITGAPQWHDQNFTKRISQYYQGGNDINLKFNNNFGTLDGEYLSLRRNYYHKPVTNLNWEYKIDDKSSLSTVVYASLGKGGGSGDIGNRDNRFYTSEGYIDWDRVKAANIAENGAKEWVMRNSVNSHNWVGLVTKYDNQVSESFSFSVGGDVRSYRGSHHRNLRDLMGAPAYSQRANGRYPQREVTTTFDSNPWSALFNQASQEEQIAYSNDETIRYFGTFGQVEYTQDKFSLFAQGAISSQSHVRFELFNEAEANEASEKVTNSGYNLKTGASFFINDNSTFFVNTGYYKRQPFHDNIYLNFSNFVNPVTQAEKIFGLEAGYKYANQDLALNVNVYRTSWKDRATTRSLNAGQELPNGTILANEGYRNTVQNQLHSGIELDFVYELSPKFRVKGFSSIGNWVFDGDLSSQYFDEDRNLLLEDNENVDGSKVGGSAQTTFGLGADYKVSRAFKVDANFNYYDNLYSRVSVGTDELKLPSYSILDLGASYNHLLSDGRVLRFRANVFNALGTEYISFSTSATPADSDEANNWNGVNRRNFVAFGKTRTWNTSIRYSF